MARMTASRVVLLIGFIIVAVWSLAAGVVVWLFSSPEMQGHPPHHGFVPYVIYVWAIGCAVLLALFGFIALMFRSMK